jgi:pimeloyl-ACP methyl ester carboxylesterase
MRGEFLDIGGARLYYYAAGSRGAGEPIILIHGFPTSGHLWSDVVPALPAGHRVVVLDLLGFGRSDPAGDGQAGINAHADRVIAVADQLGIERACLVGHGVGGAIAQAVAVRFPHRVSRQCLVSSVMFSDWPAGRAKMFRALAAIGGYLPAAWVIGVMRSELINGYADHERGVHDVELFLRPFGEAAGSDALLSYWRAVTSSATRDLAPRIRETKVPTSVVWGADDPILPLAYGRALAESIPGGTFDVIDGARHFVPAEQAFGVARSIGALLSR